MKINVLNKDMREIVDAVMSGNDIRRLNFRNETIRDVKQMQVNELSYSIEDAMCIFVEVIKDEN